MTDPAPNRLDEVLRLTAALTDQVLDAQAMGRPVPGEQVLALARSARLLQDHGVDWPPMLRQALHGLAEGEDPPAEAKPQAAQDNANAVIEGLTRFMGRFHRERGQS